MQFFQTVSLHCASKQAILVPGGGKMANESTKDFNAMLHDSKDMPKIQIITDCRSIEKYGGN